MSSHSLSAGPNVTSHTVQISVRGKWTEVPALSWHGQTIVTTGKRVRIATLKDEDWIQDELIDPAGCLERLRAGVDGRRVDVLHFSQKVPSIVPRYDYSQRMRSIAVASVSDFQAWWEGLPQETRKNVRRSQKRGVSIAVAPFDGALIKGIAGVQNESPIRQGRAYPHYGKSLAQVERDHGDFLDHCDFICAYFNGEIVGFLKLVYRGNVASLLQLNSMAAHYDKRPSNALLAKAVELCAARGIAHLTYGLYNYGNKHDTPLREFKIRHGFTEMRIPSYYVPTTMLGNIYVRLGLHRGLLDILPQGAIQIALDMRSKWYAFKGK
jgi:hypothetical protein